jgi:hypothetical protein
MRTPLVHAMAQERPILDRQQTRLVRPVLEQPSAREQARHRGGIDRAGPRAEHQQMAALDGRD